MGKIFLSDGQDKRVQIGLAQFKAVHVGTDDAEFFGLFHTHLSVRSGLDFLNWCFDSLVEEWSYMKGFVASSQPEVIAVAALPKPSGNTSSSLILETVKQFCARFSLPW